jgi:hypothetical protein
MSYSTEPPTRLNAAFVAIPPSPLIVHPRLTRVTAVPYVVMKSVELGQYGPVVLEVDGGAVVGLTVEGGVVGGFVVGLAVVGGAVGGFAVVGGAVVGLAVEGGVVGGLVVGLAVVEEDGGLVVGAGVEKRHCE